MPISVKHMQWLPSVMLVFGCSLLCLLVNGNRSFVEIDLTNSDVLLPASYIWDIKKHGYAWTGFQLPRIPSLFPDLVTYGALHLLFGDFRWAYLVYSLLQTLVFVALAGHLIGRAVGAPTADAALLFLVVISVVVGSNLQTARLNYVFSIFLPVVHFGSLVMSLAGGALALSLIEKWRSWPAAVFTICVFLAFLSNRKFLFDFMVPFFAATLVLAALNRLSWRRAGHLALCVGAGVALALVGDEFLHR